MSNSTGINRVTGQPLSDFDHVKQSLGVIFTTRLTSRVLRRTFGSVIPGLLGQPLTPQNLLKFYMAIVIAVELWEPRLRIVAIDYPTNQNSAPALQQGQFGVTITGQYRPNALSGDFTVAKNVSFVI